MTRSSWQSRCLSHDSSNEAEGLIPIFGLVVLVLIALIWIFFSLLRQTAHRKIYCRKLLTRPSRRSRILPSACPETGLLGVPRDGPTMLPRAFRRPSRQPALPEYGVCATARNCRQHGCPEGHAASSALATQSFPNKFPSRRLPTFECRHPFHTAVWDGSSSNS